MEYKKDVLSRLENIAAQVKQEISKNERILNQLQIAKKGMHRDLLQNKPKTGEQFNFNILSTFENPKCLGGLVVGHCTPV